MRKRPLIVLSTVAAATLLLAGCSGSASPEPTDTSSPAPEASCIADLKSGAGSDAVVVEGEGASAKVTVPAGTALTEPERSVVVEGDGDDVMPGDLVSLRYQLIDAVTNEVLSSSDRGPDGVLPALLSAQMSQQAVDPTQAPVFTVAAECLPLGSSVVPGIPRTHIFEQSAIDFLDDFKLARQNRSEPVQRPFLQRLGQQRMVRVGE